jgi:DNA-binding NarL/FixJ family response regulator
MDGIEATRKIKETNPAVKIIAPTSHSDEKEAILTLAVGANAYTKLQSIYDLW